MRLAHRLESCHAICSKTKEGRKTNTFDNNNNNNNRIITTTTTTIIIIIIITTTIAIIMSIFLEPFHVKHAQMC